VKPFVAVLSKAEATGLQLESENVPQMERLGNDEFLKLD